MIPARYNFSSLKEMLYTVIRAPENINIVRDYLNSSMDINISEPMYISCVATCLKGCGNPAAIKDGYRYLFRTMPNCRLDEVHGEPTPLITSEFRVFVDSDRYHIKEIQACFAKYDVPTVHALKYARESAIIDKKIVTIYNSNDAMHFY